MGQPSKLFTSAFSRRDRPQANKALRLELKNWPYNEVANCLNVTEICLNGSMVEWLKHRIDNQHGLG